MMEGALPDAPVWFRVYSMLNPDLKDIGYGRTPLGGRNCARDRSQAPRPDEQGRNRRQ
jgi:hypothetical protein